MTNPSAPIARLPKPISRTIGSAPRIFDREDVDGGNLRLRHLANAGDEQPHADAPEYKPFADERGHVAAAAQPRLGGNRACRQHQHEEYDDSDIHRPRQGWVPQCGTTPAASQREPWRALISAGRKRPFVSTIVGSSNKGSCHAVV
jgi:hypothetical protein